MTTNPTNPPDLDRMLTAFYRAEMPTNWTCPVPGETVVPARSAPRSDSRWALVASVAILVGGCWYLGGHLTPAKPEKGSGLENGIASPKAIKDLAKPRPTTTAK